MSKNEQCLFKFNFTRWSRYEIPYEKRWMFFACLQKYESLKTDGKGTNLTLKKVKMVYRGFFKCLSSIGETAASFIVSAWVLRPAI